jgi:uncharacterized membrane protein
MTFTTATEQVTTEVTARPRRSSEVWAGVLLGIGLGGFFDGIVLHQILQWHHMLSDQGNYPVTTVDGLEVNTLWDGLFHATTYVAVVVGLALMWRTGRLTHKPWSTRFLLGLLMVGWGTFNLVEGTINHHLLSIHHVNETVARSQWKWWDLGFLLWGGVMVPGGWLMARSRDLESRDPNDGETYQ